MTSEITKVTIENAAEQLKDKIRVAFVELLPDEQFKAMVQTELRAFMDGTPDDYGRRRASSFGVTCAQVFAAHVTTELKALLSSPEWQSQWDSNGGMKPSVAIENWLTANSQKIIESTIHALAGQAAQQILDRMR